MEEEDHCEILDIDQIEQDRKRLNKIVYQKSDYMRPPAQPLNMSEPLRMMQLDIDHYIIKTVKKTSDQEEDEDEGREEIQKAVLRIYGINQQGNSIMVHVHDFFSYFYVEKPIDMEANQKNFDLVRTHLCELGKSQRTIGQRVKNCVLKVQAEQKESIKFFKGKDDKGTKTYLKIYVQQPGFISCLRTCFEKGLSIGNYKFGLVTYESSVPFALRFMIDKGIVGMGWMQVAGGKYSQRNESHKTSTCQYELDVREDQWVGAAEKEKVDINTIAPLRLFSFDIECAAQKGFPSCERDPVIQIASVCKIHSEQKHFVKTVYTLKGCANIVDSEVKCFESEKDLLQAFSDLIMAVDPDLILGYNIINFDWPYLIGRAEHLKVKAFSQLGRIMGTRTRQKTGKYLSKAMGMRDTKEINMEGRVQLDMLMHMHREHKLSSYTLNNVSFQFLQQQKEDVHHSIIYDLQEGSDETRRRLAVYCLKDALLPLRLCEKMMCVYNYTEMARVTGVPLNYLFTRGQQIKVASQLYRLCKGENYLIPCERARPNDGKYEGAFVLDPKQSFYQVPIATLDFASLYPSIMISHNLCYTTLIPPNEVIRYHASDYTKTPRGDHFMKPHIRRGLLPLILQNLLSARKQAKKELGEAQDVFLKAVLDGRQLALKISANSVYGFTGAQAGQLPCLEISASVTAFGRIMIEKTQELVLAKYKRENGYEHDCDIVYGDTDSVMVKFGVATVKEAMVLGKEAAAYVSTYFQAPIKLEFEKVYFPYLLFNRKRYAGLYWTKESKWDKIDTKGIESVRRDNCALIRNMITTILDMILVQRDIPRSVQFVKDTISDLLQNKVDMSMLVITKAITKKSNEEETQQEKADNAKKDPKEQKNAYKAKQAHVELAEKMRKRDAGSAPGIGDRVAYVMVGGTKGSRNYENAEDPLYVLEHDIPIDFNYYIERQIKLPLTRIYELILPNVNVLFQGQHTNTYYAPKMSKQTQGLGGFFTVKTQCLGCKVVIPKGALCSKCQDRKVHIYSQKALELNHLQLSFNELWVQCQRCQGSLHQEVLCSNNDCPIFYKRKKQQKEISDAQAVMLRF